MCHKTSQTPSSSLTFDQFLLYHQLWRTLLTGDESAPDCRRAPLPIEPIRIISQMANLAIVDHTLTRQSTAITVHCEGHACASKVCFYTEPFSDTDFGKITGVQLTTNSCDQGWADSLELGSRTWFDVGVIPISQFQDGQGKTIAKLDKIRNAKKPNLETLHGHRERIKENVEDTIEAVMALDPQRRRSHESPAKQPKTVRIEGPVFACEDGLWNHTKPECDSDSMRVNAIFRVKLSGGNSRFGSILNRLWGFKGYSV